MLSGAHRYIVLLGSNLGKREEYLQAAIAALKNQAVQVIEGVPEETAPWGNPAQSHYLNQGLWVDTLLGPDDFLQACLHIEAAQGRIRVAERNAARTLDIDLLTWSGGVYCSDRLEIPHPRLHLRDFALRAIEQFEPAWIHPVYQKTIPNLLQPLHLNQPDDRK